MAGLERRRPFPVTACTQSASIFAHREGGKAGPPHALTRWSSRLAFLPARLPSRRGLAAGEDDDDGDGDDESLVNKGSVRRAGHEGTNRAGMFRQKKILNDQTMRRAVSHSLRLPAERSSRNGNNRGHRDCPARPVSDQTTRPASRVSRPEVNTRATSYPQGNQPATCSSSPLSLQQQRYRSVPKPSKRNRHLMPRQTMWGAEHSPKARHGEG